MTIASYGNPEADIALSRESDDPFVVNSPIRAAAIMAGAVAFLAAHPHQFNGMFVKLE